MTMPVRITRSTARDIPQDPGAGKIVASTSRTYLNRPQLSEKFRNASAVQQRQMVVDKFRKLFPKDEPKDLQVNAVLSLLNGDNTFLLAATGFGKTRVAEVYVSMYTKLQRPVMIILCPLDALGDNQVC